MQTRYFDFTYRAILDEEGKTFAILNTAIDVTERQAIKGLLEAGKVRERNLTEEIAAIYEELRATNEELLDLNRQLNSTVNELQQSQSNLQLAIESGKLGTWFAEFETGKLILSERARDIHGIPAGVTLRYNDSFELVETEDRDKLEFAIENAKKNKGYFEEEFRINPLDGSAQKWIRSSGKVSYDAAGFAVSILGVLIDITERKLDDLRKNDFIAMASHELKTPLTSVKAFIETAKWAITDNPSAHFLLGKADAQTNKMTMLINSFLNVSRLDAGKIEVYKTHCNLTELIDGAVKDTAVFNDQYEIDFVSTEPVYVYADCEKISLVMINLISNAIKYSPVGNKIEIWCKQKEGLAEVCVKDEGMGIESRHLTRLFDRFYRASDEYSKAISGFGIGLYLCAEIIKLHNGTIWAESEMGKGSSFYFTLPVYE